MEAFTSKIGSFFNFNHPQTIEPAAVIQETEIQPHQESDEVTIQINSAIMLAVRGEHEKALEIFFALRETAYSLRDESWQLNKEINLIENQSCGNRKMMLFQSEMKYKKSKEIETLLMEAAVEFIMDDQVEFAKKILENIEMIDFDRYPDGIDYCSYSYANPWHKGAYHCLQLLTTNERDMAVFELDYLSMSCGLKATSYFLATVCSEGKYGHRILPRLAQDLFSRAENNGYKNRIVEAKLNIGHGEIEKYREDATLILKAIHDENSLFYSFPMDLARIIMMNRIELKNQTIDALFKK